MSFLSPTLRLENLSTQPTMTQDHVPEDQRYNKQNIVAQWCVPILPGITSATREQQQSGEHPSGNRQSAPAAASGSQPES